MPPLLWLPRNIDGIEMKNAKIQFVVALDRLF
jgi:hypothetical protein